MMLAALENAICVESPWTKIYSALRIAGIAAGSFSLGLWVQSAHDGSASIPWLHQQAAIAHKLQTKDIPALKSLAGCQTVRAQLAMGEKSSPTGIIPNCPTLPHK